jgi:glycosyltransferase involved in cell wall biosynthesis
MIGKLRIEGDVLQHHSLAAVNRRLAIGLAEAGWEVSIQPRSPLDQIDRRDDPSVPQLYEMLAREHTPDLILRHAYPPDFSPAPCPIVFMQPWEFGSLPRLWRYGWSAVADKLLTYSSYCRDLFVQDGLEVPIEVLPLGVDETYFEEHEPLLEIEGTRLLFVGGSIARKGPDILLDAVDRVFADRDDVTLIFKDHPFYQRDLSTRIGMAKAQVHYLRHYLAPNQMPRLYRSGDIFVFPSRGEGWGLPLLEAMAAGLRCVSVNHSGCGDFFGPEEGLVIPSEVKTLAHVGLDTVRPPSGFEPYGLDELLLEAIEATDDTPQRAQAKARQFTWDRLIPRYSTALADVLGQTPASTKRPTGSRKVALVPALAKEGKLYEAARLEADNPELWAMAAAQMIGKQQFGQAIGMLDEALRLLPGHPSLLYNRAMCRLKQQEPKPHKPLVSKAFDDLLSAYEADPSCPIGAAIAAFGFPTTDHHKRYLSLHRARVERPKLSVVMIVRNEEENLERSIGSVRAIADEICVVDTGSTDRTLELLAQLGVTFVARPDLFDPAAKRLTSFADARNAAIELATGDLIFWIDADDEVPPDTASAIRGAIDSGVKALSLPIVCPQTDEQGRISENVVRHYRVFPNDPQIRFVGAIHEQVAPAIVAAGYPIVSLDAPIQHHGYLDPGGLTAKYERNLSLLLAEDDGGDWIGFNLMTTYLLMGRLEEAVATGEERIAGLPLDQAHAGKYLSTLAGACIATNRLDRAQELSELAIERGLNLVEQYFNLGGLWLTRANQEPEQRDQHWAEAERWLLKALEAPITCQGGAIDSDAGFIKPYEALIQMYLIGGRYDDARAALLQVLSRRPELRFQRLLIDVYDKLGDEAAAARWRSGFLEGIEADVQQRTAQAFTALDTDPAGSLAVLHQLTADLPGNPAVLTNYAIGLSKTGRHSEAFAIMERVFNVHPSWQGLFCLAVSGREAGHLDTALAACEAGLRLSPTDPSFHYETALCLQAQGWPDLALVELELSSLLGPLPPEGLRRSAECHLALGDRASAIEMARRTVEVDPGQLPKLTPVYDALLEVL